MHIDKKGSYGLITLITLIIVQIILRAIGMQNISAGVVVTLLVISCSLVIIGTYNNKDKGFGVKYNTIVAILFILTSITTSVMFIIIKCYPELFDKYGFMFLILSIIGFFALGLFIVIYKIIYEMKSK